MLGRAWQSTCVLFVRSIVMIGAPVGACSEDPTELVVVVESDLQPGTDLAKLDVSVTGPSGRTYTGNAFINSAEDLPVTFAVRPAGEVLSPVTIRINAVDTRVTIVAKTTIETSFIEGKSLLVQLELLAACDCRDNELCQGGRCLDPVVDASELPEWTGKIPPRQDGGLPPLDGSCFEGAEELCNDADDDCDGNIDEGVDLETDPDHCGSCGTRCEDGAMCVDGDCSERRPMADVTAGGFHTCSREESGAVYCWGDNQLGTLGTGELAPSDDPSETSPTETLVRDAAAIEAGGRYTCALTEGRRVSCWGSNAFGQLGDGTNTHREMPIEVGPPLTDVQEVATGVSHACARLADTVVCWGKNEQGQLGRGSTSMSEAMPAPVGGLDASVVASISAGSEHTCAVMMDGSIQCWGDNAAGQLGDGTTEDRAAPTPVMLSDVTFVAVAAGRSHTCAISDSGQVYCWGANDVGQLGDGTNEPSAIPIEIAGLADAVDIDAAESEGRHSCVLRGGGVVSCWGENAVGQLGDGTIANRAAPVTVVGLAEEIAQVSTGAFHTCARDIRGGIHCWGGNAFGQLGRGQLGGQTPSPGRIGF